MVQREELQFIVFSVGDEKFGVDVKQAREIIPSTELTKVPNSPDFVLGVINLREEIIPIIDLKKKLRLNSDSRSNKDEKIIIVELDNNLIGMKVDNVSEMIRLYTSDIADPPKIVKGINRDYLSGVGKLGDKLLILLDLDKILSQKEIDELDKMEIS
jgi:purine-binding chemotaxis protein CheW